MVFLGALLAVGGLVGCGFALALSARSLGGPLFWALPTALAILLAGAAILIAALDDSAERAAQQRLARFRAAESGYYGAHGRYSAAPRLELGLPEGFEVLEISADGQRALIALSGAGRHKEQRLGPPGPADPLVPPFRPKSLSESRNPFSPAAHTGA
jgi:hypothetical protein